MKYRAAYELTPCTPSPSGSRLRKIYAKSISDDGVPKLIEKGVEDVFDSIQKAGQGLALEDLIRRARAGDDSAIPEPIESYADISAMPTDMLSAHQMLLDAKDKYLRLPADVRSAFGNSFESFLSAASDGSLVQKLTQLNSESVPDQLSSDELSKVRSLIGGTDA